MKTLTMTDEQLGEMLAMACELGGCASRLARAEAAHEHSRDKRRSYEDLRRARTERAQAQLRLDNAKRRVGAAS